LSSIPSLIAGSPVAAETRTRRNPRWVLKAPRLDLRPRRVSTPIDCTVARSSLSLCFKQSERRLNRPGFNERSESPAKLRQGLPVRGGPNHPIPDPSIHRGGREIGVESVKRTVNRHPENFSPANRERESRVGILIADSV